MSPRTETIGGATLYLGDCREIVPTLGPVGHVMADPPYEDDLHKSMGRIERTDGRQMVQDLGFAGIDSIRTEIAALCVEASEGWVILFTLAEGVRAWRDDIKAAGGKYDTCCFWVKPDASPRFNGQGPARGAECFVTAWAGGGHRRWNGGGKRGIYTHCVNVGRQGEHPTEKPVPLMMELVSDFTAPGALVCDPFMGSGTTGVACVQLDRRFIGIEQDVKWFDLACRRIEQAVKQPRLFPAPPPRPVQPSFDLGRVAE